MAQINLLFPCAEYNDHAYGTFVRKSLDSRSWGFYFDFLIFRIQSRQFEPGESSVSKNFQTGGAHITDTVWGKALEATRTKIMPP